MDIKGELKERELFRQTGGKLGLFTTNSDQLGGNKGSYMDSEHGLSTQRGFTDIIERYRMK